MTVDEMNSNFEIFIVAGIRNEAMCGYVSIL